MAICDAGFQYGFSEQKRLRIVHGTYWSILLAKNERL